ncbi:putative exported protein [Serratia plymuthica 4Rx13]|uniref:Ester cyclase n=1 Tax=Serratia plymuthica TaxID=82996 RepID=A0A318NR46_SERPL|nr:ester cyclase [Serratia plymuthica]AGO53277.1 putative exported protein [Serratia plymuthica 4Rx13]PYD36340.1 ester cyclase [Serratia plymuthica]
MKQPTALLLLIFAGNALATPLIEPLQLISDYTLPTAQLQAQILAAKRYDSFWNTGDEALAKQALASDFTDMTLPAGRIQGIRGALQASKTFRQAVPDLRCEVAQMIVTGDRVVAHLRFSGHFTGRFHGKQGKGQPIDFIATDIYQIKQGSITANWHIEDNLTLLQQLGIVKM